MIKLADIFQNQMTLQRNKPCKVWGYSDRPQKIKSAVNGQIVAEYELPQGEFSIFLPSQNTMENVTLRIGDIELKQVDFGDVWIAGGQSNMEFALKYDRDYETIRTKEPDTHLRYFEVAHYSFEGEEQEHFKDGRKWNQWLLDTEENRSEFSAVGTWFAMEMREKYHVPVAIVSCNWGGTSASAWIGQDMLLQKESLLVYLTDYENAVKKLDMEKYYRKDYVARRNDSTPMAQKAHDYMMKNTVSMDDIIQYSIQLAIEAGITPEQMAAAESASPEDYNMAGPHDPGRPCGLYKTMLRKIIGFSAIGVIWYQGESDEHHAGLYSTLFEQLIRQWRSDWEDELPFIYAQIAPFESWLACTGERYPEIRRQQMKAWKSIPGVHMISSSDCGSRLDIHPKKKQPIGHRMALSAQKHIYGEGIQGDSPVANRLESHQNCLTITFVNAEELHVNGDTVNALNIYVGDLLCEIETWEIRKNQLLLKLNQPGLSGAGDITVQFAQTPYYRVNLYNECDLPAFPFTLQKFL